MPGRRPGLRATVGKAALRRSGSAVTVITYLAMVNYCLEAVDAGHVDADVIDLRWLDRASLDWDTIGASIQKTNRVLIAEQGARGTSYGGWLADEIQRRYFDWLDHPVERVTGGRPHPASARCSNGPPSPRRRSRRQTHRDPGGLTCRRCCECPPSPRGPRPRSCLNGKCKRDSVQQVGRHRHRRNRQSHGGHGGRGSRGHPPVPRRFR